MSAGSRNPQLKLKLDAGAAAPANRWCDGAELAFLGGSLRLVLDTRHKEAVCEGAALALPLPPQATPRQIQDRAEAWLRAEAKQRLQQIIEQELREAVCRGTMPAGRRVPRLTLSFATRGNWVEVQDGATLRCNWRLIEQPAAVIGQAIARAIAALPPEDQGFDLFGMPPATH